MGKIKGLRWEGGGGGGERGEERKNDFFVVSFNINEQ